MPFKDSPVFAQIGPRKFELREPLKYEGNRDEWLVPVGFTTDLASVPQFLWSMFPPFGNYTTAAIIHDFLYEERPLSRHPAGGYEPISRKDADGVFLRIMKEEGVSWWRRRVMYRAVRTFGWTYWQKRYGVKD